MMMFDEGIGELSLNCQRGENSQLSNHRQYLDTSIMAAEKFYLNLRYS